VVRENRDREFFTGLHVNNRDTGAGIVVRIVPGERVNDIGPERDILCCPAHALRHGIIQGLRERNIGRDCKVHDRDACILAHRDTMHFGQINIFKNIRKFPAGNGACLGSSCFFNDPQHVRREADDGAFVRSKGGISKGWQEGVRFQHSCTLRSKV
jgi:hypothetical protein